MRGDRLQKARSRVIGPGLRRERLERHAQVQEMRTVRELQAERLDKENSHEDVRRGMSHARRLAIDTW